MFNLIQAHLADELDLEPDAISAENVFVEDLAAHSLDWYTLVQELEDTYGVRMSDEQAAEILTVGRPWILYWRMAAADVGWGSRWPSRSGVLNRSRANAKHATLLAYLLHPTLDRPSGLR